MYSILQKNILNTFIFLVDVSTNCLLLKDLSTNYLLLGRLVYFLVDKSTTDFFGGYYIVKVP